MSDLTTRLREHVDTAAPPIDIDALVERLQHEPPLTAAPPARQGIPGWALAFVVAAVMLVLVGGAALLFSGAGSVEPADTIPPPTTGPEPSVEFGPVFDLETDYFCAWFTAEDMNRIVATAQQRAGTDFVFKSFEETVLDSGIGRVRACNSDFDYGPAQWANSRDLALESHIYIGLWSTSTFNRIADESRAVSESFAHHDLLHEDVTYRIQSYNFGRDAGIAVYLSVEGHENDPLVFTLSVGDPDAIGTPKYEELGLAIADEMISEMGWIDPTPGADLPAATTVPRPTVNATTEYDLETDDLCEWLTAEEMDQIIAYAQQRAGTDFVFVPFADPAPPRDRCGATGGLWWGSAGWTENPAAEGSILIALRSYFDDPEAPVDLDWFDTNPQWFENHRLLDDAVGYHVSRHTVAYHAGVQIQLRIEGHDDIFVFAFGVGDEAAVSTPKYEELGLAIANELLLQMNWIDG